MRGSQQIQIPFARVRGIIPAHAGLTLILITVVS